MRRMERMQQSRAKTYIKEYDWKQHLEVMYFDLAFRDVDTIVYDITNSRRKGEELYAKGGVNYNYESDAIEACKRHMGLLQDGMVVNQAELNALYGMIHLCKKHNIRPILITTPFREEYNEAFDKQYIEQVQAIINNVCEEEQVEYYDYSNDNRFVNSSNYMRNADHLTSQGAVLFTDEIVGRVMAKP